MNEKTIYGGERVDAAELVAELLDEGFPTTEALDRAEDIFAGRDECEHNDVMAVEIDEAEAGGLDFCNDCGSYL